MKKKTQNRSTVTERLGILLKYQIYYTNLVHDVTNEIFSRNSNYNVNVVMIISVTGVIIISIL